MEATQLERTEDPVTAPHGLPWVFDPLSRLREEADFG